MIGVGITGFGAVSAAGLGADALWQAVSSGVSQVGPLDLERGEPLRVRIAASVRDFDPTHFLSDQQIRRCDRYTQFAHVAVEEALAQAGLDDSHLAGPRTAVIIGTGIGGMNTLDFGCYSFYTNSFRVNPLSIPRLMPSSAASHVSITHHVTGPCFAVTSACSSASQSIGIGLQLIRAGIVDRAIVGGSEACLTPATVKAWEVLRVLSPDACRPFDKKRNGLVLGEGAGIVILESAGAMAARGAEPLVWLAGYGTTSDAKDIIQPDVEGAANAMQIALDDAQLKPADVGYVNAHGTGTVLNDINEAEALNRVFGEALGDIPVSSSKAVIGHALGAAGALELIITIRALTDDTVPPQINFLEQDPRCSLPFLPTQKIQKRMEAAMSNTFAFGGINAALIVSKQMPSTHG